MKEYRRNVQTNKNDKAKQKKKKTRISTIKLQVADRQTEDLPINKIHVT